MQDSTLSAQTFCAKIISSLIGVSTQTLRNWEAFFGIDIERNEHGQRIYTETSLKIFKEINNYAQIGLKLKEIKPLLNINFERSNRAQSKIEVITENREKNVPEIEFILKPYMERIRQLEITENKYISAREEIATLKERVKNKDEIINMLSSRLEEYKARKWWQILR